MSDAAYVRREQTLRATELAAGPWDSRFQHGGAPSALAAWAAEQVETPSPMRVARLTVELLRPVPVGEIAVETEVLRQGRKIQLVQVRLLAAGVEVTRANVLKVRTADQQHGAAMPALDAPPPDDLPASPMGGSYARNFASNFDIRRIAGGITEIGPGRLWFRQHRPLIAGEPLSPAMRAAAVADFSNGVSAVLPFTEWTFLNADLTVSLARDPEGEWIFTNAETWAGPDGIGVAMTRLADTRGYFGIASQSLVLERR